MHTRASYFATQQIQLQFIFQYSSHPMQLSPCQSKKAAYHVAKMQYYLTHTAPELFCNSKTQTATEDLKVFWSKKCEKNMVYYFCCFSSEGISSIDAQTILESSKKLYLNSECIRISDLVYKRTVTHKLPYLPVYGSFHEIIEFYLIDHSEGTRNQKSRRESRYSSQIRKAKQAQEQVKSERAGFKSGRLNNMELFVIHHCEGESKQGETRMKWQNFIQKYHFLDQNCDNQIKSKINYSMLFNFQDGGYLNSFSQGPLYEMFLGEYVQEQQGGLQNINKLQGLLLQSKDKVDRKLKQLNDPSFQENHKRWLRLPTEYYKQFLMLKKQVLAYYKTLYDHSRHSQSFICNLICRYMHAKEYAYKQTLDSLIEYLKWQQQMASSFNLTMFTHHHEVDFFTFLGYDYEGRVVILNKASNLKVDSITSVEDYCNYYIYFLQIFLQKHMQGYADQYTIIADISGLSSDNFKLAITKRNIADSLKYSPERQYKLIAVNVSIFAYTVWGILKPLLPKKTLSKINIIGTDVKEIVDTLSKEMDVSVIPEYLGGKNTKICSEDLQYEKEKLMLK